MEMGKIFNVAVYLRLSRDDGGRSDKRIESDSIGSQRDMICSYIERHADMEIFDIYADDGWSGINFDRPEFKRMMMDIEDGKVNCVIVKDLSRLGRDYIEAGRLIQRIFPALSVRFISLVDRYDSLTADYNEKSLVVPVKNFINDSYCRDISQKVRSHQRIKREKGEFIGSFAVYGYKKSKINKNQLIIDDYAAGVVKRIFLWKLEGYSIFAIANRLNDAGILSPLEYKKLQGEKFCTGFITGAYTKWSSVAVKRILTNEVYIGTLVQGKTRKINYKMKEVIKIPEEEWSKVENTHRAIISKTVFQIVQRLICVETRIVNKDGKPYPYTGLLFCGECMESMVRRVKHNDGEERIYYICSKKNKGKGCTRHSVDEKELDDIVMAALRQHTFSVTNNREVLECIAQFQMDEWQIDLFKEELGKIYRELEKYQVLCLCLCEDLKECVISQEEYDMFRKIYEKRCDELRQIIEKQQRILHRLSMPGCMASTKLLQIQNDKQMCRPDRMLLVVLIKRILVYEDKRIDLELNYHSKTASHSIEQ